MHSSHTVLSTIYCYCTCIFTVLRTTLLILKKAKCGADPERDCLCIWNVDSLSYSFMTLLYTQRLLFRIVTYVCIETILLWRCTEYSAPLSHINRFIVTPDTTSHTPHSSFGNFLRHIGLYRLYVYIPIQYLPGEYTISPIFCSEAFSKPHAFCAKMVLK